MVLLPKISAIHSGQRRLSVITKYLLNTGDGALRLIYPTQIPPSTFGEVTSLLPTINILLAGSALARHPLNEPLGASPVAIFIKN